MIFDKATGDIEGFITDVKNLAELQEFPDAVVISSLKKKFPEHEQIWLFVHELEPIYEYLRQHYSPSKMTSKKEAAKVNQSNPAATPFNKIEGVMDYFKVMQAQPYSEPCMDYFRSMKARPQDEQEEHCNVLETAVDKLTEAVNRLTYQKRPNYGRKDKTCQNKYTKPFKPYIAKGRDKSSFIGQSEQREHKPQGRSQSYPRQKDRNNSSYPQRSRSQSRIHPLAGLTKVLLPANPELTPKL